MDVGILQKKVRPTDITYGSDRKTLGQNSDMPTGDDGMPRKSDDAKRLATGNRSDITTNINMEREADIVIVSKEKIQKNSLKGLSKNKDTGSDGARDDVNKIIRCKGDYKQSHHHDNVTGVNEAEKSIEHATQLGDVNICGLTDVGEVQTSESSDKDVAASSGNAKTMMDNENKDDVQGTQVIRSQVTEENVGKIKEMKDEDHISVYDVSASSDNLGHVSSDTSKDSVQGTGVVGSKKTEKTGRIKERDHLMNDSVSRNALRSSPVKQDKVRVAVVDSNIITERILVRSKGKYNVLVRDGLLSSATEDICIENTNKDADSTGTKATGISTNVDKSSEKLHTRSTEKSPRDEAKNTSVRTETVSNTEKEDVKEFRDKDHPDFFKTNDKYEAPTCHGNTRATNIDLIECSTKGGMIENRTAVKNATKTDSLRVKDKQYELQPGKNVKTSTDKDGVKGDDGHTSDAVKETFCVKDDKEKLTDITGTHLTKTEEGTEDGTTKENDVVLDDVTVTNVTTMRDKSDMTHASDTGRNTIQRELPAVMRKDRVSKGGEYHCSQMKINLSKSCDKEELTTDYDAKSDAINTDRLELRMKTLTVKKYVSPFRTGLLISTEKKSKCMNTGWEKPKGANRIQDMTCGRASESNSAKPTPSEGSCVGSGTNIGRLEKGLATGDDRKPIIKVDRTLDNVNNSIQSSNANQLTEKDTPDGQAIDNGLQTNRDQQDVIESCVTGISASLEGKDCVDKGKAGEGSVITVDNMMITGQEVMAVTADNSDQIDTNIIKSDLSENQVTCIPRRKETEAKIKQQEATTTEQLNEASGKISRKQPPRIEAEKQSAANRTVRRPEVETEADCCTRSSNDIKEDMKLSDQRNNQNDDVIESSVITRRTKQLTEVNENENTGQVNRINESKANLSKKEDKNRNAKKRRQIRRNKDMITRDETGHRAWMESQGEDYYTRGFTEYSTRYRGPESYQVDNSYTCYSRAGIKRNVDPGSQPVMEPTITRSDQKSANGERYDINNGRNRVFPVDGVCRNNTVPITRTNQIKIRTSEAGVRRILQPNRASHMMFQGGPHQITGNRRVQYRRATNRSRIGSQADCSTAKSMWPKQNLRLGEDTEQQMTENITRRERTSQPEDVTRYVSRKGQGQLMERSRNQDNSPTMQQNKEYASTGEGVEYTYDAGLFPSMDQIPQSTITSSKEREKKSGRTTGKDDLMGDDGTSGNKTKKRTNKGKEKDRLITRRPSVEKPAHQKRSTRGSEAKNPAVIQDNVAKSSETGGKTPKNAFRKFIDVISEAIDNIFPGEEELESETNTDSEDVSDGTKRKQTKDKLQRHQDAQNKPTENNVHREKRGKREKVKRHDSNQTLEVRHSQRKTEKVREDKHHKSREQSQQQQFELTLPGRQSATSDAECSSASNKAAKKTSSKIKVEDDKMGNDDTAETKTMTTKGSATETETSKRCSEQESNVNKQHYRKITSSGSEKERYTGLDNNSPKTVPSPSDVPKKNVFQRFMDVISTNLENPALGNAPYRKPSLCLEIYNSLTKLRGTTDDITGGGVVPEEARTGDKVRKAKRRRNRKCSKESIAAERASDMCLVTQTDTSTMYVVQAVVHASDDGQDKEQVSGAQHDVLTILEKGGDENLALAEIIDEDFGAEFSFESYPNRKRSHLTSTPALSPVAEVDELEDGTAYYFGLEDFQSQDGEIGDKLGIATGGKTEGENDPGHDDDDDDDDLAISYDYPDIGDFQIPGSSTEGVAVGLAGQEETMLGTVPADDSPVEAIPRTSKRTNDVRAEKYTTQYDAIQREEDDDDGHLSADFLHRAAISQGCASEQSSALEHTAAAVSDKDSASCNQTEDHVTHQPLEEGQPSEKNSTSPEDSASRNTKHVKLIWELEEEASQDDKTGVPDSQTSSLDDEANTKRESETNNVLTKPGVTSELSDDSFSWDFSVNEFPSDDCLEEAAPSRNDPDRDGRSAGLILTDGVNRSDETRTSVAEKDQEHGGRNDERTINSKEGDLDRSPGTEKRLSGSPTLDCTNVECIASGDKIHLAADKPQDIQTDVTPTCVKCK